MARPDPVMTSFKDYLRKDFASPEEKSWRYEVNERQIVVTHREVKEALRKLSLTDPQLSRILNYLYRSNRKKEDIATSMNINSSTLDRRWHKAIFILWHWIFNGDICVGEELAPIDLILMEDYKNGYTIEDIWKQREQRLLTSVRKSAGVR